MLVTGMGGHLGTRVSQLLEQRADVAEIAGFDVAPPRRRLRRATFKLFRAGDGERMRGFVREFAPTDVVHFGVHEPGERVGARDAGLGDADALDVLMAAVGSGALERVVLRSGIEIYGRGRRHPKFPAEDAPLAPTTPYGRTLLAVEEAAARIGAELDVAVCALRLAPVAASHTPSPVARVLRLPVVPVPALADPSFQLLHTDDAARAAVQALDREIDGPVNVVGAGVTSPWQAARRGGRIPIPVWGPGWAAAAAAAATAGAPAPPQVLELLRWGRCADGGRATEVLGLPVVKATLEVLADLHEWASVTPIRTAVEKVA
ncbi:MAG: NAD-dependent epimerase/dehydratase family protein [Actinobacteria bacterium]|nr:MAG: NAD-dependent epimerase/dehydratase family protein [Actinomycetota bacterium]